MLYTKLTKKAMNIAYEAHKDQYDKSGLPYIFHPFHLAEQMQDEVTTCIALLHDVVEDTDITFDTLREKGFTEEIISALQLLTHNKEIPYMEYVEKIKQDPNARKVKLADLRHNSDLTRLEEVQITEYVLKRNKKYQEAIKLLTEEDRYE